MKKILDLGEFISELEGCDPSKQIIFDDDTHPNGVDSYRGYYSDLAIGKSETKEITAGELLYLCKDAIGKTFTGWKGGEYEMDANTTLWVAEPGECTGIQIFGIDESLMCYIINQIETE